MGPYGDEDQDQQQPQANAGQRPGMAQRMAGTAGRFLQNRYRAGQQGQNGSMSMRKDGQNVPGNQPGGQNGSYGPYGQSPQSQPPAEPPAGRPTFGSQVAGGMQGGQPIGRAVVGAAMNRYRAPQRQNPAPASGPPPAAPQSNVMPAQGQPPQAPTPTAGSASSPPSNTMTSPMETMNFGGGSTPQMAEGGVVSKPTVAMLGEKGPEAVIPLSNPDGKLSPGMFTKTRYRRPTGPSGIHAPIRPLEQLAPSKLQR